MLRLYGNVDDFFTMKLGKSIYSWINQRIPLDSLLEFLNKPVSKKLGIGYSLGTVLWVLILLEIITGIAMTLYYVPTPDHARDSIEFIRTQVMFGKLIFGLHVWTASAIVIFFVTWLLYIFFIGGYKSPRQLTWIVGILLGLVIFGFLLTGYLLPWDQKSYWGTMVRTHIIESVPGIGHIQAKLLRAGDELGVLTMSRFYSGHVVILPLIFLILVSFYLFLICKRDYSPANQPSMDSELEPFFPRHAIRHLIVAFLVLAILCFVVYRFPAPLDKIADPTDSSYVPRPEWYFLFLNQLLRYFDGRYQFIGTTVIPTAGVLLLLFLPFIDRNPRKSPKQRPFAIGFASIVFVGLVFLTVQGALNQPHSVSKPPVQIAVIPTPTPEQNKLPVDSVKQGEQIFQANQCITCHQVNGKGGTRAGNLSSLALQHNQLWLEVFVNNPNTMMKPQKSHPSITLNPSEKVLLIAYLSSLTTRIERIPHSTVSHNPKPLLSLDTSSTQQPLTPKQMVERGMQLFDIQGCDECHTIGDEGGVEGPDLTFEGRKNHDADWHMRHFADPRSVSPGSKMPKVRLSQDDLKALTAYILSLQ